MTERDYEPTEASFRGAFLHGDALSMTHAQRDWSHGCRAPVGLELHHTRMISKATGLVVPPRWVELRVECRGCASCLSHRAWRWTQRGVAEAAASARTHLVTLTVRPELQFAATCEVSRWCEEAHIEASSLSGEEMFARRCEVLFSDIQRMLKRIRHAGAKIRYMVVAEAHRSGDPHFHMLLHEVQRFTEDAYDTYALVKREWTGGFADMSGVDRGDTKAVRYLCKYLSKAMAARVRASVGYGRSSEPSDNSVVRRTKSRWPEASVSEVSANLVDSLATADPPPSFLGTLPSTRNAAGERVSQGEDAGKVRG